MKFISLKAFTILCFCLSALLHTSCTVDQEAGYLIKPSKTGNKTGNVSASKKKTEEKSDWAKRMEEAKAKREEAAKKKQAEVAAAKKKSDKADAKAEAKALAEKKKADREKERELLAKKKLKEQGRKEELAEKAKSEKEKEAKKLEAKNLAEKKRKERESKTLAAKKLAEEKRKARELASASSSSRSGGGFASFFGGLAGGSGSRKYKSEGHYVFVNQVLLNSLSPANAKVEVDLSEQRVRVYKTGGARQLVIESSVSSGKSGFSTSPGTFRIQEKKVEKRSTLYGRWVNSGGETIPSNGEIGSRPGGASSFVGASMPYWMRINGGIGMHIGHVPDYPASHGCIRVPSAVQPLIFSKVGVGTTVTVKH